MKVSRRIGKSLFFPSTVAQAWAKMSLLRMMISVPGCPKQQDVMVGVGQRENHMGGESRTREVSATEECYWMWLSSYWVGWGMWPAPAAVSPVAPEQHHVLLKWSSLELQGHLSQVLFDTCSSPAVHGAILTVPSLYASGCTQVGV